MEEELNENDLEDRMYAMLHHVDESQANVTEHSQNNDAFSIVENTPSSTVRRYWRPHAAPPRRPFTLPHAKSSPYVKTNPAATKTKPKDEEQVKHVSELTIDTLFQSNPSQNLKTSIEFLDNDNENQVLELDSSDDDEVIEVALPPKPTITIESSDEEVVSTTDTSPSKKSTANIVDKKVNGERAVSASPVPSVVSSVSDDFIRGDCIALNISSKCSDNHSFDFSLHGSDLLIQDTPSKKKKRKKNKESTIASSSIVATSTPAKTAGSNQSEECFATPKSKSTKKQKSKSHAVQEKSVPQMDIYDSDSNQSMEATKIQTSYVVSEKSFPSIDVYESDSSQPESVTNISILSQQKSSTNESKSPDSSDSDFHKDFRVQAKPTKQRATIREYRSEIDLTDNMAASDKLPADKVIEENFVMANVTGFKECDDFSENNQPDSDPSQFGSTKIPAILNEDLDFDIIKGTDKFCLKRKFSASELRAEMEKFYNESWGGENFNHREIQKRMSKDKSLWKIDPRDRMPSLQSKKKIVCGHCSRAGHRDERCWRRVPVCHMCGVPGHVEPRCPRKMCMNCGAPSEMYCSSCRRCRAWRAVTCGECGQRGHPPPHCPDRWRRYHATTRLRAPRPAPARPAPARPAPAHCSGCARRGHLVHACRAALPFSELPIYSPHVVSYAPALPLDAPPPPLPPPPPPPPPAPGPAPPPCKRRTMAATPPPPAPDDASSNRDKRGRIIQDNAVSATSDAVPPPPPGAAPALSDAHAPELADPESVDPESADPESADPEPADPEPADPESADPEPADPADSTDLPRNRFNLMRKLSRALASLQEDLGDPRAIHQELTYRLARHGRLRRAREVSPRQLANNWAHVAGARRRLRMVLLGQAGLAGGGAAVARLAALAAALPALRRAAAPPALRAEAARHYAHVFGALPRDDYVDLLHQYYRTAKQPSKKTKKKRKRSRGPAEQAAPPPAAPPAPAAPPPAPSTPQKPALAAGAADARPQVQKTLRQLVFAQRRLAGAHVAGAAARKRRVALVRVLTSQIAALQRAERPSSKAIKKMKKTHAQAQAFLETV